MKPYTKRLVMLFFGLVIVMAGFIMLVDPYDMLPGPRIAGFNARKTRVDEDGRRVAVGQAAASGRYGTLLFGNSRAVEGFPRRMDDTEWPGRFFDAGLRGGTSFEMSRAVAIAGASPTLRCVIIGFDPTSFTGEVKTRSTYWISALPDGNANMVIARTSLSSHAFYRSVQTIVDNVGNRPPRIRYPSVYEPGEQRRRTLKGVQDAYIAYRKFGYDETQLAFLKMALKGLAERGVQVIGIILPRNVWQDEALYESGRWGEIVRWRSDIVASFETLARSKPAKPCVPSETGAVLWDFAGFQMAPYSTLPGETAREPQPYFHESTHFSPRLGLAVLDRVRGRVPPAPFDREDFGIQLGRRNLELYERQSLERREAWIKADPEYERVKREYGAVPEGRAATLASPKRFTLSRDDWNRMEIDLRNMRRVKKMARE